MRPASRVRLTAPERPSAPASSARPRSRPGVEVINERRAEDAASRLIQILNIRVQDSVCLFDFNGVLNTSWWDSVRVLRDLKRHSVKVGVLSYCRKAETIHTTGEYLRQLGEEVDLYIPAVITPRQVPKDCWRTGDWWKADLVCELLHYNLCFIDDRVDIIQDCSWVVPSPLFRAIPCNRGVVQAIAGWTVPKRGSHYLDLTDTRVVKACN